jgi:hypothetical protein
MYSQYDLKSLIDQRHQEALREAQTRRLARQARPDGRPRGLQRVDLAWRSVLAPLLRGARLAE